jgi:hypothetical protein
MKREETREGKEKGKEEDDRERVRKGRGNKCFPNMNTNYRPDITQQVP